MTKIYSQAKRVFVWLGESSIDNDICIDQANLFGTRLERVESYLILDISQMFERSHARSLPGVEEWYRDWSDPLSSTRQAWDALLNRPWFERMWVIQEVAVAEDVEVLSGGKRISLNSLRKIVSAIPGFSTEDLPPHQTRATFFFNFYARLEKRTIRSTLRMQSYKREGSWPLIVETRYMLSLVSALI
jgi:hypothetical protein